MAEVIGVNSVCHRSRSNCAFLCLQEADNWTTLSADVEEVLDSGDIDAVSDCLIAIKLIKLIN